MSSRVFHVLFADDAKPWTSFLNDTVRVHRQTNYEFRSTAINDLLLIDRSPSASTKRLSVEESEVLLVILSPAQLTFLVNNQQFDYQGLVRGGAGQKGVIFFCGVDQVQLEGSGDLRGRFPWYSCWTKVAHTDADGLMDVVDRALPFPSLTYDLIPSTIRCESVSMVTASFSDVIASKPSDLQMSLYVDNGNEEEELKVTWINDKTVRFKAPERKEGKAKVRVLLDGNVVRGTEFLDYESPCELISDMMQLYIQSMNQLFCSILSKSLLSAEELDGLLFGVFNDEELKGIQPKAFEELFGIFRYSPESKSQVELPTLLHLANKFELKRFKSWLTNLPDAALAARVKNSAGQDSDSVNVFTGGTKQQLRSSTSQPCLPNRQTGQIASPDCPTQQSNFDEEEDFYLVMEKQSMPCEKQDLNGDDGDDNEDDEDYLVMDKVAADQQRKMSDKPVLKDNDDDDDNEDDEDYLVMDKASEKQWKLCENETVDEDIYDLCTATDDIAEEQEQEEGRMNEASPVTPNSKTTTEATNLKNMMIEQLPGSLEDGQQRLIQLMNQFKAGELTMDEVNILFQEWKINNPQKQVHISDRCSALQMQASTLPNYARRRTEHELTQVKGPGYPAPRDTDRPAPPPNSMYAVVDPISRNTHRGSVTLERRVVVPTNNKTGNYRANTGQNPYSRNSGTDVDMADGDSYSQVSPNKGSRSNNDGFAPPLPARKQALKQPNKSATLPPLPSRPRRN